MKMDYLTSLHMRKAITMALHVVLVNGIVAGTVKT